MGLYVYIRSYDQRVALERSQMSMNEYFGLSPAAMTFVAVRDPAAFNEASLAGTMAVAVTGGYAKVRARVPVVFPPLCAVFAFRCLLNCLAHCLD